MPRSQTQVTCRQREARALQLRLAGTTYSQIGGQLGVSESRSYRIVQSALDRLIREPADEVRRLELLRLDQLWVEATKVLHSSHVLVSNGRVVLHPGTRQPLVDDAPVLHAIDRLLKIQERRARLLGLDAPAKHQVFTIDAIDAEIRRLEAELAGYQLEDGDG